MTEAVMRQTDNERDAVDSASGDASEAQRVVWAELPEQVDRGAFLDDALPGQPLSMLVFVCDAHQERKAIEYYDPADPPRCSQGDLMVRKPR
jgi:hypothetical protein